MEDTLKADLQAVATKDSATFTVSQEVVVTTKEETTFSPQ